MSLSVAPPPASRWRRFTAAYAQVLTATLAFSVAILVFPVTLQVVSRYTDLIPAYIWTEEMARFLFIWLIMIGAMVGVREAAHFEVDVWPQLKPRGEAAVRIAARLGILAMSLIFVFGGIEFTRFAWYRTSELADLPLWMIHIAWPTAGVTWIVFLGEQFVDEARIVLGRTPS
ncbi:MAG: TRAP transporter small permease subunit [Rhodospirillaceae bacterium]|nr:TRAP transporter small permease subunit [Rhodospirillaceae bacterium]